jgi:hypothetical protein
VFSQPLIKQLFGQYTLVRLYTDGLPKGYPQHPSAEENKEFQKTFGNVQLPLYVILQPLADGQYRIIDEYKEGMIKHVDEFIGFLKQPLERRTNNLTASTRSVP